MAQGYILCSQVLHALFQTLDVPGILICSLGNLLKFRLQSPVACCQRMCLTQSMPISDDGLAACTSAFKQPHPMGRGNHCVRYRVSIRRTCKTRWARACKHPSVPQKEAFSI